MEHIKDFIKLQQAIPIIKLNAVVNFNKVSFKYADLPSIHKVVKPLIGKHNFMLTYKITDNSVTACLLHVSGESFTSSIQFTTSQDDKQTGAKITYYKRYTISALLAIDTDDDKDALPIDEKPKKAKLTEKAFRQALEKISNGEKEVVKKVMAYFDVTQDQHDRLLNLDLEVNG